MLPLLNSIYSAFTSNPTLTTAFPGGLHRDQSPEGTTLPYVVSRVVASETSLAYSSASRTITQIRFSAFGIGHDAAGTLIQELVAALDEITLTLSAGTHDMTVRKGDAMPVLKPHDGLGDDVWEWDVVYEFGVVG